MHLCALLNPQHDQKDAEGADTSKCKPAYESRQTIRGKHDITDRTVPRTVLETVSVCSVRTKQREKYTYPKKYLHKIAKIPPYSGGVTDADSSALFSKIANQEIETIKRDSRGVFTQTKHYATIQQDLREEGKWLASQRAVSYSDAAHQKSHPVVLGKRQSRPTTKFLDYVAQETVLPSHTGPKPSRLRKQSMKTNLT